MIDPILEKQSRMEQEAVLADKNLTSSEKDQLIALLEGALTATNGFETDEKVRRIVDNDDRMSVVISQMYRDNKDRDVRSDAKLDGLAADIRKLDEKLDRLASQSGQSDSGDPTIQGKLMDWATKNQFWLLLVFIIIAVQGGKLAEFIGSFF